MKTGFRIPGFVQIVLALLALPSLISAEQSVVTEEDGRVKTIFLHFESIRLSPESFDRLRSKHLGDSGSTMHEAVLDLIEAGDATVIESALVAARQNTTANVACYTDIPIPKQDSLPQTLEKRAKVKLKDCLDFAHRKDGLHLKALPSASLDGKVNLFLSSESMGLIHSDLLQGRKIERGPYPLFDKKCKLHNGETTFLGLIVPRELTDPKEIGDRIMLFARPTVIYGPRSYQKPTETSPFDAQEGDADSERAFSIELEQIKVPYHHLRELLKRNNPGSEKIRDQVEKLIEKGSAEVLELSLLHAQSENPSTNETVHEYTYPIAYDYPGSEPRGTKDPEKKTLPLPVEFTTRNIGIMTGGAAAFNSHRSIEAVISFNATELAGQMPIRTGVHQPLFSVRSVSSALELKDGVSVLAAVLPQVDEKGGPDLNNRTLLFVRCRALKNP